MNPYWHDYQALKRDKGVFSDSAMITMVFKAKLSALMSFIRDHRILGEVKGFIWRIEYQKRGLPHAHILFWTDFDTEDTEALDSVIDARYPKDSPFIEDKRAVQDRRVLIDTYQQHEHTDRCWLVGGGWKAGYPQRVVSKTTVCNGRTRFARGPDEVNIVTHNPTILDRFPGHHCLEVIHSNRAIAYVLKYCTKNSDAGEVRIHTPNSDGNPQQTTPNTAPEVRFHGREVDKSEKLAYFAATRILSAPECFAQICGFWRHHLKPTVLIFTIHLEGKKVVLASSPSDALQKVDIPSPLERFFRRPAGAPYDRLTVLDYHSKYVTEPLSDTEDPTRATFEHGENPRTVKLRRKPILCMLGAVHVSNTELFTMRILLRQFPARNWQELRTHNGTTYETFSLTVRALGIISDRQDKARMALTDAAEMNRGPSEMRFLLAEMVRYGANRRLLETEFASRLADENDRPEDVRRKINQLLDRHSYITPGNYVQTNNGPHAAVLATAELQTLNERQRAFASHVIRAVQNKTPQLMFLQGSAGTGKPFTVKALIKILRAMGMKCLIAATTGIAAVQYHGGCTLHSLFKLGFDERAGSTFISGVGNGTPHADYLMAADLIIIDEVSMLIPWVANRVSLTLKSISPNRDAHFGGKQILFVGDFLQLPPVVPGFAVPVIRRLITRTAYWPQMTKYQLSQPMRAKQPEWVEFLSAISRGDTHPWADWRKLHRKFGVTLTTDVAQAKSFLCQDLAPSDQFPLDRLWIAPTNKLANQINQELQEWRGEAAAFLGTVQAESRIDSQLTNCPQLARSLQRDFADNVDDPDLPPHMLTIFKGDAFGLLRNIDTRTGLAKGRRCSVIDLRNRTAVLRFDDGHEITLTRMCLHKTSSGITFNRWQIPIRLAFAGTVHRSQGMTLGRIVIDCRSRFWEHGQLYVALSRVTDPANICVLLPPDLEDFSIHLFVDPDVVSLLASIYSASLNPLSEPISPGETEPQLSQYDLEELSEPEGMMCIPEFNDIEEEAGLPDPPIERAGVASLRPDVSDALLEVLTGLPTPPQCSIGLPGPNPTRTGTLVKAAVQFAARTSPATHTGSGFQDRSNLQNWLVRNRILFGKLLACVRAPGARLSPDSISRLVRPNITACPQASYLAPLVLTLFHIQPLRRLIICWPNPETIALAVGKIFATLELGKLARVDSLALLCNSEPTEYNELLQVTMDILSALRSSAPVRVHFLFGELFRVDLSWQISVDGTVKGMQDISHHLLLRLRVAHVSSLGEAIAGFFNEPDLDNPEVEVHNKVLTHVPSFLFIFLDRGPPLSESSDPNYHHPISFPWHLDLRNHTKYWGCKALYQLGAVISVTNQPNLGKYRTFLSLYRQWFRLDQNLAVGVQDLREIQDKWADSLYPYQNAELFLCVCEPRPPTSDFRARTPEEIFDPTRVHGPSAFSSRPCATPAGPSRRLRPVPSSEPAPLLPVVQGECQEPGHIPTGTLFSWHPDDGSQEMDLVYLTTGGDGNAVMMDPEGITLYYIEPRFLTRKTSD
jgi:hypothetical protein